MGATVSWAKGDRLKVIVPSVATTALQLLTNRATVRDDQNRSATATAGVTPDIPAPPNAVSVFDLSRTNISAGSTHICTNILFIKYAPFAVLCVNKILLTCVACESQGITSCRKLNAASAAAAPAAFLCS
jgi:hypothetical protein